MKSTSGHGTDGQHRQFVQFRALLCRFFLITGMSTHSLSVQSKSPGSLQARKVPKGDLLSEKRAITIINKREKHSSVANHSCEQKHPQKSKRVTVWSSGRTGCFCTGKLPFELEHIVPCLVYTLFISLGGMCLFCRPLEQFMSICMTFTFSNELGNNPQQKAGLFLKQ